MTNIIEFSFVNDPLLKSQWKSFIWKPRCYFVPLVAKWSGIYGTEDKYITCEPRNPLAHQLTQTDDTSWPEHDTHVLISWLHERKNWIEPIHELRSILYFATQDFENQVEAHLQHQFMQEERGAIKSGV